MVVKKGSPAGQHLTVYFCMCFPQEGKLEDTTNHHIDVCGLCWKLPQTKRMYSYKYRLGNFWWLGETDGKLFSEGLSCFCHLFECNRNLCPTKTFMRASPRKPKWSSDKTAALKISRIKRRMQNDNFGFLLRLGTGFFLDFFFFCTFLAHNCFQGWKTLWGLFLSNIISMWFKSDFD